LVIAQAVPAKSETTYWMLQRRLLPHGMYMYTKMIISQGRHDLGSHDEKEVPAWADFHLGLLFASQIRLVEAEAIYKRALTGYEKALGVEHSDTLSTVNNLGLLYSDQGKLAEAEAMYTRALAGYEIALGAEHTNTLGTVNNLGGLYYRQGKLAEAEAMYTRALAGYEKALGAEHTYTLNAADDLGTLYRKRHYIYIHAIKRSRIRASTLLPSEDTSTRFIIAIAHLWMKYGQARAELLDHLGHMLLLVGNLQDAAISFEQRIVRDQDGLFHSNIVCHGCDIRIRLPNIRYVCRSCEDVNLCPECHQNYELEGRLDKHVPACQDHEFLAIPREGWSFVPSGAGLTDGSRAKMWLQRFLASSDESRCTASSSKQDQGLNYQ
jgi:tetratricopeptide (TPR) repeat protein